MTNFVRIWMVKEIRRVQVSVSHPSRSFIHPIVESVLDIDRSNRWLLPHVALARCDRGRCSGSNVRIVHS